MFTWNFAKTAEAMFSRWAIKRVFKFFLKKKLGKFLLGDIDLDQLHVQLTTGTIHLSDLALNVDYINQKFGASSTIIVREGSIGSLMITMPWKGGGCQVEVDELEIVLAPCLGNMSELEPETCVGSQDNNHNNNHDGRKQGDGIADKVVNVACVDIHEGVKTIAKMLKWMLTKFCFKVRKLIVAFDPCRGERTNDSYSSLVLRITEAECGTCISEDFNSKHDVDPDDFLASSQLTNLVKFQGVALEFLKTDLIGDKLQFHPLSAMTPLITGKQGGFSGTLKLSIPWKNGALDVHRVDADAHIEPLEVKLQPQSIQHLLHFWNILKDANKTGKFYANRKATESVYYSAGSYCYSPKSSSSMLGTDNALKNHVKLSTDCCSSRGKETMTDTMFPESHIISDWVPSLFVCRTQEGRVEEEPDFGASMDQFFECFDGLRNSQSALGNSGVWNWTCSVFSAITAASNLTSGSMHIPNEKKHIETNLGVAICQISVFLSFIDEEQKHPCDYNVAIDSHGLHVHYVDAKFEDLQFLMQIHSQETDFEAKVGHIEMTDNYDDENDVIYSDLHGNNNIRHKSLLIQEMQTAVEGALPYFISPDKLDDLVKGGEVANAHCCSLGRHMSTKNHEGIFRDNVTRTRLLRTSGISQCQINLKSGSSDSNFNSLTYFSLRLAPFVFWFDFGLLGLVLDLLRVIEKSCSGVASEALNHNCKPSSEGLLEETSSSHFTTFSSRESFEGNIFIPKARIVFCFPAKRSEHFRIYSSWIQFIAIDISSSSSETDVKRNSKKKYASAMSCSLHLNMGNLNIYLINPSPEENVEIKTPVLLKPKYFAQSILSATSGTDCLSVMSMFWREGTVTGSCIADKGKRLASFDDRSIRYMGKGSEFASVTTSKDIKVFAAQTQSEMILSSMVFLNLHLSVCTVNISRLQYEKLHHLVFHMIESLSCMASDPGAQPSSASQVSILMECDSLSISITATSAENVKSSIQNELPGSWHGLRLEVKKFELLYVSNVGGLKGANFFSLAHGEGNLWGSIREHPNKEYLLISCSDSTKGRGDGEGSNVLSSRCSGSYIVHSWDPQSYESYTSITVRCGTLVAVGGRLDWLNTLSSFFIVLAPEIDPDSVDNLSKQDAESGKPCGYFLLNLVDIGLSYEPHFKDFKDFDSKLGSTNTRGRIEPNVACLLAASSLKVSSGGNTDSVEEQYTIRVHDLGMFLCPVSELSSIGGRYSAEHLRKIGYVKVAQEAHVEVLLRINCKNGHLWEVECYESHIVLNTCYDTAFGLICLVSQLQRLFAPDLEESIVHLQTRWNNTQQAHGNHATKICNSTSSYQSYSSSVETMGKTCVTNIMDDICEDAFRFDDRSDYISSGKMHDSSVRDAEKIPKNLTKSASSSRFEESQMLDPRISPRFIEEYFLSDVTKQHPLSEASLKKSSNDICKSREIYNKVVLGNSGWYRGTSLSVLENHVEVTEQSDPQHVCGEVPGDHLCDNSGRVKGCFLFKNINVTWKMFAGYDWKKFEKHAKHSAASQGRNTTECLEFALFGLELQYNIFPDGGVSVSKLSLSINDFRLNDRREDAPWKLVLGYYQSICHPRESSSTAFKLDLEAVRPDCSTPLEEYRLRLAFLPMRLHLHQCQLDFLITFFGQMDSSFDQPSSVHSSGVVEILPKKTENLDSSANIEKALLPYFQKFDIRPVVLRVDYSPCGVDFAALRGGKYVELVNLFSWKGVELELKNVQAVGVYGWSCVGETIIGEWLEDVSQNQVHKLLKGLRPIQSFLAVSSGVSKLVSLPMKNYRKEHRLLKGIQRGVIAFLQSISLEAVGLGVHLAAGTHEILLQAEYTLANVSSSTPWLVQRKDTTDVRSNQPKDIRQGILQAYESISEGLGKSTSAIVGAPMKKYQRGAGIGSALATAVQAAPAAVIAPASGAARAVHCALLGVRNRLDPEREKESVNKYLGNTQQRRSS